MFGVMAPRLETPKPLIVGSIGIPVRVPLIMEYTSDRNPQKIKGIFQNKGALDNRFIPN